MRELLLKVATTTGDSRTGDTEIVKPFPYRQTLIGLLKFAPATSIGVDLEEIAKLIPIIRKLSEADDLAEILLEDEEWRLIKGRVETAKWNSADQAILDLIEDIRSAPSTTLDALRPSQKKGK